MAQEKSGSDKKSLDIQDNEFTQGKAAARDIPNAQVGEGIQGAHGHAGASEQLGDVGNQLGTRNNQDNRQEKSDAVNPKK